MDYQTNYNQNDQQNYSQNCDSNDNNQSRYNAGFGQSGQSDPSGSAGQSSSGGWIHTDSSTPIMTPKRFRQDCRAEGRNALLGHLGVAVGSVLGYFAILMVLQQLTGSLLPTSSGIGYSVMSLLLTFFVNLFSGIYLYGLTCIFVKLQYGQQPRFSDLFLGFRESQNKVLAISLVQAVIYMVAMIPAMICTYFAGDGIGFAVYVLFMIVWAVAVIYGRLLFYPAVYLLLDYPNLSAKEILQRSARLMKGHKKELLVLELSFWPMWLLAVLSLGIASLWVRSYVQSTMAAYYRKLAKV